LDPSAATLIKVVASAAIRMWPQMASAKQSGLTCLVRFQKKQGIHHIALDTLDSAAKAAFTWFITSARPKCDCQHIIRIRRLFDLPVITAPIHPLTDIGASLLAMGVWRNKGALRMGGGPRDQLSQGHSAF
jgi:hypothetical protein